jgi:hypothetical protein
MKRWQGSCIGALFVLLTCGSSLIFLVPFGSAMIVAMPPVFDRLTAYVLCPDPTDYSYNDYGSGTPTTSSPSGGTGHYTELACTYADGSQKVFGNEGVGVKGLSASFIVTGICGGLAVFFLMIVAALIGARVVKPKETLDQ